MDREYLKSEDFWEYQRRLAELLSDLILSYESSSNFEGWKAALDIAQKVLKFPMSQADGDANKLIQLNVLTSLEKHATNRLRRRLLANGLKAE